MRSPITTEEFAWDRPIIVIGAGRSGSTLLSNIIGAHPDVYNAGETDFLVNRLWGELFAGPKFVHMERRNGLIHRKRMQLAQSRGGESQPPPTPREQEKIRTELLDAVNAEEEVRISPVIGRCMAETLIPPPLRVKYWTFKEIWNGSKPFQQGWRRHDLAFPGAQYVHIVRHPIQYLCSFMSHTPLEPTKGRMLHWLDDWTKMNVLAHSRAELKGRYLAMRYESLVENPAAEIPGILGFLGLPEDNNCFEALSRRYNPRKRDVAPPIIPRIDIESVPGLVELAERYDYDLGIFWQESDQPPVP